MDKIKLTQAQRRIIVEHFAEECASDLPAELTGLELEHHLEFWRLKLALALDGRWVDDISWAVLVEAMMGFQSFDRDADGWLYENGHGDCKPNVVEDWRNYINDEISARIDRMAG